MTIDDIYLLACQLRDQVLSKQTSPSAIHPSLKPYDDIAALETIAEAAGLSDDTSMLLAETITSYLDICPALPSKGDLRDDLTDQIVTVINWLLLRQLRS